MRCVYCCGTATGIYTLAIWCMWNSKVSTNVRLRCELYSKVAAAILGRNERQIKGEKECECEVDNDI